MNRVGRNPFETNDAVSKAGLGHLYTHNHATYGWGLYKYVKFEDAITYKRGMLVSYTPTTPYGTAVTVDCSEAVDVAGARAVGVCCYPMTAAYYGFIQVAGMALVIGDGGVAAGDLVIKDPSVDTGIADTVSGETGFVCGQAQNADDTANDPLGVSAMFVCWLKGMV